MTVDGIPAETESPISEDARQRGVTMLQELLASGRIELDRFQQALDGLLGASTEAAFAAIVRSLPPPVDFTPPARRRDQPMEVATSVGEIRLEGHWQVGVLTKIEVGTGVVTVDLTAAEFDDWDVEIVVHTVIGVITVIVPRGFDVRLVGRNGAVTTALEPAIPGFPVVRLSATSDKGTIRVVHPVDKAKPRRSWRRRSQRALQP